MELTKLIDTDLWNEAKWVAVAFGSVPSQPPMMVLAFTNGAAAKKIFQGLRAATGPVDHNNVIRIAIIEGDLPGEMPGYSVHIGPNPRALPPEEVAVVGRIQRMNPEPGSLYLPTFKSEYAKHGRYALFGGSAQPDGTGLEVHYESLIEKSLVVFRQVSEIDPNDIDGHALRRHTVH